AAIEAEIAHIRSLAVDALRRRWRVIYGRAPPAARLGLHERSRQGQGTDRRIPRRPAADQQARSTILWREGHLRRLRKTENSRLTLVLWPATTIERLSTAELTAAWLEHPR